jgi:hypothetical protein
VPPTASSQAVTRGSQPRQFRDLRFPSKAIQKIRRVRVIAHLTSPRFIVVDLGGELIPDTDLHRLLFRCLDPFVFLGSLGAEDEA